MKIFSKFKYTAFNILINISKNYNKKHLKYALTAVAISSLTAGLSSHSVSAHNINNNSDGHFIGDPFEIIETYEENGMSDVSKTSNTSLNSLILSALANSNEAREHNSNEIAPIIAPEPEAVDEQIAYLTFDDGPNAETTPIILDILAEKNVHATFFLIGKNVEHNPEILKRIVADGHSIGIHTNTHDYNYIYSDMETFKEDFYITRDIIIDVTGVDTKLYRFPGGSVNSYNSKIRNEIVNFLDYNGYVYFDWNASIDDTVGGAKTPAQLLSRGLATTSGNKVIMLAHDTKESTVNTVAALIDELYALGYEFRVLSEAIEPIQMTRR